ncbi:MAG: MetQ/NlpA family ABC transporter substrate-binding protein [Spirochaetaceae bacterium]|jgi:D-methionine transport system substrate-binding protein|nr:MetQ/NlpA family ABC transporter substrate-binding protein [Spirochaetaceae bacterium]
MKNRSAVLLLLATAGLIGFPAFAAGKKDSAAIKVGATAIPHAVLLNLVKDDLAKEGVKIEVIEYTDYVVPNEALENGELAANYFQHIPYLESFNKERGFHLVNAGGVHIEPFALYSGKYKSLADIPAGARIAIPNDPTNEGRALLLLQAAGLITLKSGAGLEATPLDIAGNTRGLVFEEVEAATLPRVLQDVDGATINGNYALAAGLNAKRDGIFVEGASSPYVNVVAVKQGRENDPAIKALVKALQSQKVKDFINREYPNGEVIAVF